MTRPTRMLLGLVLAAALAGCGNGSPEVTGPAATGQPTPAESPAGDAPIVGAGTYGFVADLCRVLDLSPAFDILPPLDDPEDWIVTEADLEEFGTSHMFCAITLVSDSGSDFGTSGNLTIDVETQHSAQDARQWYENGLQRNDELESEVADDEGSWQDGTLQYGHDTISDVAVAIYALDANLTLSVSMDVLLAEADDVADAVRAAVLEIAERILEAARR